MDLRKTLPLIAVLAGVVLIAAACSEYSIHTDSDRVRGSGAITTERRDVSGFDRIVLMGEGTVTVSEASEASLLIETDENLLTYIDAHVAGATLTISTLRGVDIDPTNGVHYHITAPQLTGIELRGVGTFDLPAWDADQFDVVLAGVGDINIDELLGNELDVDLSGVGSISVSGSVGSQTVTMRGVGDYDAGDLRSDRASVTSGGAGQVTLWVTESLEVDGIGVGNVSYYGDPDVENHFTGFAAIRNLGSK